MIDEDQLKARWPEAKGFRRLGQSLFLVSGVATQVGRTDAAQPPPATALDSPREHAAAFVAAARKKGILSWARPDGKTQVSVRYEDDRPVAIDAVVVSTQHAEEVKHKTLREAIITQASHTSYLMQDEALVY